MSDQYPRIYLARTQREWEFIEKKIQELGKKSISEYISSKIPDLKLTFQDCPDCICFATGTKVQKWQYIRLDRFELLAEIAEKTGIPQNALVNKLIIEPLLIIP